MVEQEQGEQKLSQFNSGIAIQIRLNKKWEHCNNHSCSLNFHAWNLDLDAIWRELIRDYEEDSNEYKAKKVKYDLINKNLADTGPFIDKRPAGWKDPDKTLLVNREKQYTLLSEKELFLRRLENEIGKGSAFSNGDDDDFE